MTTPDAPALPLRPELADQVPYGAPQLDVPVLLNVNENPYPPSEEVVAGIAAGVADAARSLNRYPDRDFPALRQDLADYLAVESGVRVAPEQVWAANGSNEVMLHLLQAFGGPGRTALSFAPTYSMYPEYARDTHTRWVTGRRAEDFTIDATTAVATIEAEQPSVILLASPNNPTGTALPRATLEVVLEAAARIPAVVVVDEAYAEFRRAGTPSALELVDTYPHLAVTRTMSKAFAAAGLRLGYLAASAPLVDALRVVRLPYHLSAVTQAAARAALSYRDLLLAQVADLRAQRDALVAWLRRQHSAGRPVQVAESDANFVLFGTFADRHAVWQGLLDRGVLIRETGPDGWLRVSVGTREETQAFQDALTDVIAEQEQG
ncbi:MULTISPECIES: histidinol-phosphate transaminase [unclassified Isoptericola]|uniref:histidinol-phosphate transaminase n=1 Tax=unclassified Isoptericola TaxID=2623355 RepID=UPI002713ADB4|nr:MULTISPECIES: histidinol-phosphate transaminase [unclassified Isoptericola]MDO8144689.1 histidinol-phosphate transaminase [Isoptericola sp. 178]MDO8148535.1 histidinol-phosphate transaminase [Isoptericola sp. b515]MDO8152014.1 histidinol-phosphate transaminase [Isoptericola sp. b408]